MHCTAAGAARCPAGLQAAKQRLLAAIAGTERGGEARALQRGLVEEAQASPLHSPVPDCFPDCFWRYWCVAGQLWG